MNKRGIYIARDAEGWLTFHLQKPTFDKINKEWRTKSPGTLLDQMKKAFKEIEPCTCAHIPISKDLVLSNNSSLDKRTKKPNYISSDIKDIFPELKENEDEKIRKGLIVQLQSKIGDNATLNDMIYKAIACLENQGEQKSFDYENANIQQKNFTPKVESKFKVGDWVVRGDTIAQILDIQEQYYVGLDINGKDFTSSRFLSDDKIHLWTIQDAKNGDVLAVTMYPEGTWIGIFKEQNGCTFSSYCFMNTEGTFKRGTYGHGNGKAIRPATKEQRDLLFQKMKEAGYEWDAEKKKPKKLN